MSLGQTPLIPPSELSKLNRLDQYLERGKEGDRMGSSLDISIRKPTIDYRQILRQLSHGSFSNLELMLNRL